MVAKPSVTANNWWPRFVKASPWGLILAVPFGALVDAVKMDAGLPST
ncbi:MAG TPA: hypothetical protein VFZ25_10360 [Chloroflexota bacterium]|nr:hypothetical protein [Chloroflexota bacterium]